MRILLTGFEPFAEFPSNPSQRIIETLSSEKARGQDLFTAVLPVDGRQVKRILSNLIDEFRPTSVVSLGLANGRERLSLERVAFNLLNFSVPDNGGWRPQGEEIIPGGPRVYFSGLPLRRLFVRLRNNGVPAEISNNAGAFLCNETFFLLAHHSAGWRKFRGGFIHLPCDPDLARISSRHVPSMSLELMLRGIKAVLDELRQANLS